ncbi:PIG-L deacetylase family protein [Streptomyces liangshanensis]|uniref:PIG-L family deacetylase n=1 Tax=Streptomyces liangshanensis TaxID=2717324 RepID=A0A6G9H6S8_9ACTN|nr:PIG-L family deacetylase [Streptomyces liangshanensis]QIQ06252.1 PIG-L family deacetylase [Streptomyces liangshanensis]
MSAVPRPAATGTGQQAAADAIDAQGTPEARWAAWAPLADLPAVALPAGPVVVVAAHPDDEVLGFGGALSALAATGTEVRLLSVTDGEGSHPRSRRIDRARMAELREAELLAALAELGLPGLRPTRLGVPDTQVHRHEARVAGAIGGLLRETGAALCVAPWAGDLHSDHEAAGRAARAACATAGVPLWSYPVWMWHWARPGDPRVPWADAARLPMPAATLAGKTRAVGRFTSQIAPLAEGKENAPILPPEELAHHTRPFEVVFR